jgi:hypothetical protein
LSNATIVVAAFDKGQLTPLGLANGLLHVIGPHALLAGVDLDAPLLVDDALAPLLQVGDPASCCVAFGLYVRVL